MYRDRNNVEQLILNHCLSAVLMYVTIPENEQKEICIYYLLFFNIFYGMFSGLFIL